jgi:hypothetical protein
MLEKEASEKRAHSRTFNPQLADCSIGDKRRGDAMEPEERERRENEKRRVCVSGPCEGVFTGSRRGPQALFPLCVRV